MTTSTRAPRRRLLCALVLSMAAPLATAWTQKPVRLLVPAPPGGTIDVVARIMSDQLAKELGQPVIVDNKPGAGGAIAVQAMLAAPADGQTLMVAASNVLTEIPHLMKTGFDPLKDVKPLAFVGRSKMVLVGGPQLPAKDFKSLLEYLKANPGKMSFASYSAGTASQYAGMILNQKSGLDLQHVPFAGSPPALTQVASGQIPIMFDGIVTSRALIAAGKLQVYGVAARTRSSLLPQVPTLAEQGYPDLDFSNWVGVIGAAKLPAEISEKIHAVVARLAASDTVRERLAGAGFEVTADEPLAQMQREVRAEFDHNATIVKTFDIRLNQ